MSSLLLRRCVRAAASLLTAAALVGTAACGSSTPDTAAPAGSAAAGFPVTITHALGTAEIPTRPTRIVALGNSDISLAGALGAQIVAAPRFARSADGNYPDVTPPLTADVLTLDQQNLDLEAIAAARPDLILTAGYYQVDQYYAQLAAIAPTVAYETRLYGDTAEAQAVLVGRALGVEDRATALAADAEQAVADFRAAHPELQGKRYAYGQLPAGGSIQIYTVDGPTTQFSSDLGMVLPEEYRSLPTGGTRIPVGVSLSLEQVAYLDDADIALLVPHSDDIWASFTTSPLVQNLRVSRDGHLRRSDFGLATALVSPNAANTRWILDAIEPSLRALA